LRKHVCERVARIEERLPGNDLLSIGQREDNLRHHVQMPNDSKQMLSTSPPRCEPILDRPLAGSGPPHDRLHGLMAVAQFRP
jgi:hypothetical protein